ncbi:MAG: hypothetical protein V4611_02920 [Patescibacteria group bacterium]
MDPNQQNITAPKQKMSKRTKIALWCLIGPTALYIVVFALFAIINLVLAGTVPASTGGNSENLFGETSIFASILNIILFVAGLIAFVTWLPGIIFGIVILTTKKSSQPQA